MLELIGTCWIKGNSELRHGLKTEENNTLVGKKGSLVGWEQAELENRLCCPQARAFHVLLLLQQVLTVFVRVADESTPESHCGGYLE